MLAYLRNRRPTVVGSGDDREQIIIPPLNTDVRFEELPQTRDDRVSDTKPSRPLGPSGRPLGPSGRPSGRWARRRGAFVAAPSERVD